jgi:replicative DNA helicase
MELFNLEAEQTILGTIITNNAYFDAVSDFLKQEHFYFVENQIVYGRLIESITENQANQISLKNFFESNEVLKKVGGVNYLSHLLLNANSILSIRALAKTIIELFCKRQALKLIENYKDGISESNFNKSTATLIEELANLLISDAQKKTLNSQELLAELESNEKEGLGEKFVPTGFPTIDDMLDGGIYSKTLTILAARPSVGKTSACQQIILNTSKTHSCFFLSLEVDRRNGLLKFLSNLSSVAAWKYKFNKMNQVETQAWFQAKNIFQNLKIEINDSNSQNIAQVERIVKTQLAKKPIDLLVVDYVQIIKGLEVKNKNESQVLKEITTSLKAIARTYDIAVLALAQINRKGVESADQRPTMNDIKGSGGFEEDADSVLILHRARKQDKEGQFSETGNLILAKNRHGRTGEIDIQFTGEFNRITELKSF